MRKEIIGTIGLAALLCLTACTGAAGTGTAENGLPADAPVQEAEATQPEQQDQVFTTEAEDGNKSASGKKKGKKSSDSSGGKREKPSESSAGESTDTSDSSGKKQRPSGAGRSDSGKQKGSSTHSSGQKGKKKSSTSASSSSGDNAATVLKDGDALTGGTYTAQDADQSVLEASGTVKATVTGAVLNKTSGDASSADDSSFTGVNAAVRVYGDANVSLNNCTVNATAQNATGVFSYENGVITMDNCTVTVTGGGAGGVQVAGGGTLYGTNLTVTSASKAAIRSDRGGGTMILDGGTYTSTGSNGCPAIYSTADITVKNAECVSTGSRAVIIEGKNTVTLENCALSGNDQSTKEGSVKANVLLYQSASGDASEGTSVFTMTGGSMKSNSGAMFYCTNTDSMINLENAELILSDDGTLLIVSAGRWGKDGKNGGSCTLNAKSQLLSGTVTVDSISSLMLNLTEGSSFTGSVGGEGAILVTMDASSVWKLTGDSYIDSIEGDLSGLDLNGYTLYVSGVAYAA